MRPARKALRALARRRQPRTLIEFACRLELDAAGVRDTSRDLSPARLAAVAGDVSMACLHLSEAVEAWAAWLGSRAVGEPMVGAVEVAIAGARVELRSLLSHLRQANADARAIEAVLITLARHDLSGASR